MAVLPYQKVGVLTAAQTASTAAAPVLAGFAFALIGLVLTVDTDAAWPDATVAILVGAALLLVLCTQFGLAARVELVSPAEERAWFGSVASGGGDRLDKAKRWSDLAIGAYNSGLVLLLDAVAVVVVPSGATSPARWIAIAVAVTAAAGETAWLVSDQLRSGNLWQARLHGAVHLAAPTTAAMGLAVAGSSRAWALPSAALGMTAVAIAALALRTRSDRRRVAAVGAFLVAVCAVVVLAGGRAVDIGAAAVAAAVVVMVAAVHGRPERPARRATGKGDAA